MLRDVVSVHPLPGHRLPLTFDDGVQGTVDVAQLVSFTGVFEALRDPAFFNQVKINPELGTIQWPNDADLDTDVLYAKVTGVPIPDYVPVKPAARAGDHLKKLETFRAKPAVQTRSGRSIRGNS